MSSLPMPFCSVATQVLSVKSAPAFSTEVFVNMPLTRTITRSTGPASSGVQTAFM